MDKKIDIIQKTGLYTLGPLLAAGILLGGYNFHKNHNVLRITHHTTGDSTRTYTRTDGPIRYIDVSLSSSGERRVTIRDLFGYERVYTDEDEDNKVDWMSTGPSKLYRKSYPHNLDFQKADRIFNKQIRDFRPYIR